MRRVRTENQDETMDENDNTTGPGHNDRAAVRALEGIREYQAGVTKEQAGRDDAIAGIIKYGAGLIEGRGQLSDKAFGEWVRAQGLDATPPFNERQERAAAQQIAAISSDGTTTVTSFEGCPHSRPTNIMRWWRAKQPKPAPEPHAQAAEAVRAAPVDEKPAPAALKPASPAPDRVQKIADNAEFATLKKELIDARAEIERLQRRLEAEQRKLLLAQRQTHIEIEEKAEARAGMIRQFARDKLTEWAQAHSMFDIAEWRLLNMAIQNNASDETRHKAGQLLNERAFLATGGKMGKPDDIARAKRTRAEAMAERTAKAKATRDANKAAKAAADKPVSDDTLH